MTFHHPAVGGHTDSQVAGRGWVGALGLATWCLDTWWGLPLIRACILLKIKLLILSLSSLVVTVREWGHGALHFLPGEGVREEMTPKGAAGCMSPGPLRRPCGHAGVR